jgi:hypothetical protein
MYRSKEKEWMGNDMKGEERYAFDKKRSGIVAGL